MSMERRALLAFVLSIALFFVWDAVYLRPRLEKARRAQELAQQRAERQRRADSLAALGAGEAGRATSADASDAARAERGVPTPAGATAPGAAPAGTLVPAPGDTAQGAAPVEPTLDRAPERRVRIVSSRWALELSTWGGRIVSARLPEFLTAGRPVELFPQDPDWTSERVLSVTLVGERERVPLDAVSFDVRRGGVGEPLDDGATIRVDDGRTVRLVLRGALPDGRTVEREYVFTGGHRDFEASVRFDAERFTGATWSLGPGMRATEQNVRDDESNFRASVLLGEEMHQKKTRGLRGAATETFSGMLRWASVQTKYFTTALIPPEPVRAEVELTGNRKTHHVSARVTLPAGAAGGTADQRLRVYVGPLDMDELSAFDVGLERTIEMGWKMFRPIALIVLWAMKKLYGVIPNYGWVIIIISALTKVLFFRLTHKSFKSMKELQALQPRIEAIKQKYRGDQQRIGQETMRLYREAGVNPLGGCLPMLLQMPVFIALYNVLRYTIELRGAPWLGWITDLSRQDVLFHLPLSLPFIGDALSVLPLVMGATMVAQSKLGGSPTGGSSASMPAGFQTLMPIMFTVLFYRMPSGLVLYWIVNTVLSVAQQWYIHREAPTTPVPARTEPEPAAPARPRAPHRRRAKKR